MRERFAAWFVTGPLGHLASGIADWAVLIVARRRRRAILIKDSSVSADDRSMSRFANLPIAVRLGAAFGLLALALLAVTLIAVHAFGTFRDDTQKLADRDVRAVAVAGELGQNVQAHRPRDRRAPLRLRRRPRLAGRDRQADVEAMRQAGGEGQSADARPSCSPAPGGRAGHHDRDRVDRVEREGHRARVQRSRQETVENVEERDGSRDLLRRARSAPRPARCSRGRRRAPGRRRQRARDATADAVAARAGRTLEAAADRDGRSRC